MGNFLTDSPSPFDADVAKLTSRIWDSKDWKRIINLCCRVESSQESENFLRAIMKRLNVEDPNTVGLAITLLDIFSHQCGKKFQLKIASSEFTKEFQKLLDNKRRNPEIYGKLTYLLRKWATGYYKKDRQLGLIPELYKNLQFAGLDLSHVFEKHYPWSFRDKYPVEMLIYKFTINESQEVLKNLEKGGHTALMKLPPALRRCEEKLIELKNEVNDGIYLDFKGTADILEIQEELSNVIQTYENERKLKKL